MNWFYHPEITEEIILDPIESSHCIKVLRCKKGDRIDIIDGKGHLFQGIISEPDSKKCKVSQLQLIKESNRPAPVHIGISPTKNMDRIEWFVEKATEMGATQISFIKCDRTERKKINLERVQKKVLSAIKQSKRLWMPEVQPLLTLEAYISSDESEKKYIAFVDDKAQQLTSNPHGSQSILIGPEGDFTEEELQLALKNDYQQVSLGKNVLRTETAGITACVIMSR